MKICFVSTFCFFCVFGFEQFGLFRTYVGTFVLFLYYKLIFLISYSNSVYFLYMETHFKDMFRHFSTTMSKNVPGV